MHTLAIKERASTKNSAIREAGSIPAVMYGRHEKSTPIEIELKAFEKIFKTAGESTVIELTGLGSAKQALIHEVDTDPVTGTPRHADFYVIEKGQKVTVSVPLAFVGVSSAVKDHGGILVKVIHELEIEVDPTELPHEIEVDISRLATLDDQVTVKDLNLPVSAVPQIEMDEVVAMVSIAKDEPEEPAGPVDLSAIEVEKKGKKEEEGAEGESAE